MARQWTSVLRGLIRLAAVGVIVASFGVTTRTSTMAGSALQQSPRLIDVVAGVSFGCALSSDGSVHCWGANDKGQLGIGTMDSASHGVTRLPGDFRFRSLRAGFNTVCGVTEQDDAFCWGAGDWAQLGNGRWGHSAVPTPVTGGLKFRAVMPGGTITCGIAIGGELYCWGGNNHGQAGVGDKNGDPDTSCCYKRPRRVAADRLFKAVMAGGIHGCAVDVNGKGYCWGYQHDGRLGNGEPGTARNVPDLPAPVPISTDATLTAIAGRSWQTCAFTVSGDLVCWGHGEHGRLGNGSADSRPIPTRVVTPTPFKTVSVGSRHSCGVTEAGVAYCWGSNESGEVGGTASGPVVLPREVQALRGVSAIAAGGTEAGNGFTCALAAGRVVCWGANNQGQRVEWAPQGVSGLAGGSQATAASRLGEVQPFVGKWQGTSEGQPGTGTLTREYRMVLGDRFIEETNRSVYPPQEKNPKGEIHEHRSFFSFDNARKTVVYRQFHQEGFVNQYVLESAAKPGALVFVSEALENIPRGYGARETYTLIGPDEFEEVFEIAEPGKDFVLYSKARLKRVH